VVDGRTESLEFGEPKHLTTSSSTLEEETSSLSRAPSWAPARRARRRRRSPARSRRRRVASRAKSRRVPLAPRTVPVSARVEPGIPATTTSKRLVAWKATRAPNLRMPPVPRPPRSRRPAATMSVSSSTNRRSPRRPRACTPPRWNARDARSGGPPPRTTPSPSRRTSARAPRCRAGVQPTRPPRPTDETNTIPLRRERLPCLRPAGSSSTPRTRSGLGAGRIRRDRFGGDRSRRRRGGHWRGFRWTRRRASWARGTSLCGTWRWA
jgi:hypothetical protein